MKEQYSAKCCVATLEISIFIRLCEILCLLSFFEGGGQNLEKEM